MVRYGKSHATDEQDDNPQQMKVYRADRKYRGHKLAVAVGHNRAMRSENSTAGPQAYITPAQHRIKHL